MKLAVVVFSVLFAGIGSAQYGGVPPCATDCVNNNLPESCMNDFNCICTYPGFIENISCCVSQVCDEASIEAALNTARDVCKGANIVLPSGASCSNSTTPTATDAAQSSASPTNTGAANKHNVNGVGLVAALIGAVAVM